MYTTHNPDSLRPSIIGSEIIKLLGLYTIPDEESEKPFLPWGITKTR